jgi:hypothetical protein
MGTDGEPVRALDFVHVRLPSHWGDLQILPVHCVLSAPDVSRKGRAGHG